MKVFVFDLLPYDRHFEEFKTDKFMPYPLPGKYFDREIASRTYEEHFQVWEEMDRLGFDGVGLNEHHTTPHGLMCSPNMMAAVGATRTKNLKFLILGELLPLHNPLRIAEEIAMADCISKGRVWPGFARGVPREYRVFDVPQSESRARFEEAYDIILKAWTQDTFTHEGKFWSFKDLSIWPRPYQDPYPRTFVPFAGSGDTIAWAGRNNVRGVLPYKHPGVAEDIIVYYAKCLAENGYTITPEHLCLFTETFIADSKEQAIEEYSPYYLYFNQTLWHHGSLPTPGSSAPPPPTSGYDYLRPENRAHGGLDRDKIRNMTASDLGPKIDASELAWGKPGDITDYLIHLAESTGSNVLLINMNFGALPKENFLNQIRRFGTEILPTLQKHEIKRIPSVS